MKKMLFVFNPNSGKAQIKNQLMKIIQVFSDSGYEVTVYPTKAPMDGYQHIVDSEGRYDVIACSGGDGTLNETVAAILKYSGNKPPIGYIPSGTTNDFAASLGIPRNMVKAAAYIADGELFPCDVGMMNDQRSFNYVAAFGAFTRVSYGTPQNLKNVFGHQAYVLEAVKSLSTLKPEYMRVYSDEIETEGNFVYGMISNTNSVGGIKNLTGNDVDLQDGLFEVTLIRELNNPLAVQSLINAFLTKDLSKCDWVCTWKTKKVRFESPQPVSWTLDGEFGGEHKDISFSVKEKAVEFLIRGISEQN
ncbi:MAG: diacylglycerol kinase family lipid kinase [Clostridia bacterium]|nr:diacylglycerol kinase family lipid kinase [Clostridia bacterium]